MTLWVFLMRQICHVSVLSILEHTKDLTTISVLEAVLCANSRCYCNERPSTAGRNQDYFLSALYPGNLKSCLQKTSVMQYTPMTLNAFQFAYIHLRACYECARFTQHTLVKNVCVTCRETTLWFQYSAGKNYQVSLQQHLQLWIASSIHSKEQGMKSTIRWCWAWVGSFCGPFAYYVKKAVLDLSCKVCSLVIFRQLFPEVL